MCQKKNKNESHDFIDHCVVHGKVNRVDIIHAIITISTPSRPIMRNFPPQGIPFAAPPVGKLRWEAPEPIPRRKDNTCWAGTLKTKTAPPVCTQKSLARNVVSGMTKAWFRCIISPHPHPHRARGLSLPKRHDTHAEHKCRSECDGLLPRWVPAVGHG